MHDEESTAETTAEEAMEEEEVTALTATNEADEEWVATVAWFSAQVRSLKPLPLGLGG